MIVEERSPETLLDQLLRQAPPALKAIYWWLGGGEIARFDLHRGDAENIYIPQRGVR